MNAVTHTNPSRPRILFVDDSRLMRACATRILGQQFDLVLAESAEQAWELLQADSRIEALFSDLHMGGKSGLDLLQEIREADKPHLIDLPVVLITGEEDGETKRKHALLLGATDFISKPFQASELTARASAYAQSGQSARRLRLLEQDHHIDSQTGLGNRRYCEERLMQAMSFAHRHKQPLTLMHLRLDGLTALLGELGEPHASRALKRIGDTLGRRVRREDTVFRSDTETFSFLLPATDAEGAETLQERFMPDLDELGLRPDGEILEVEAGFIVQTPPPPNGRDGAQILEEGLAGRASPVMPGAEPEEAPGIEKALRMIERGQGDRVKPHLASLQERLRPLLDMLDEAGTAPGGREDSSPRQTWWHSH
ncbi:GGDEF domain-containing response regulator [Wenzhouxiangella sp. EGI_FJ10305]|uniref:GGDEF domain-containing response regulator n=1 Tax=Wenzhouxiangella sp. EGI_FJ10305 TaxID=3243768 RepID=UPI0035D9E4F6